MMCPVCKSMTVYRKQVILVGESGTPFECNDCGFSFYLTNGKMKPIFEKGKAYKCPFCQQGVPMQVNLPLMVPRLGLECTICKKTLCIWEGENSELPFAKYLNVADWVEGFEAYEDPFRESVRDILCTVFFDSMPVLLGQAVELMAKRLEETKMVSRRVINRIARERAKTREETQKKTREKKEAKPKKKSKKKPDKKAKKGTKKKGKRKANKKEATKKVASPDKEVLAGEETSES